uniref:ADP-ribosyl cyclase/cyclic ADP-ribose hydrolase 1-like n=1 Tax=Semicossyphus pulcher TaxID=241346 RepID=UPI0037E988CB
MVSKKAVATGGAVTVVVVVVVLSVLLTPRTAKFKATFMKRCEAYGETSHICEQTLATFEQAYVGKDHSDFSEGNYDQLFAETNLKHPCGKTMFWSKREDLIHKFTGKGDCFIALKDTFLGHVLDGLKWCGKEGNKALSSLSASGKKKKSQYEELHVKPKINPVTSFWNKASAKFAQHACGHVTAMLDGERKEPYDPKSFFGGVEVPNLQPSKVTHLTVVLVGKESGCTCESLGSLRKDLHQSIGCTCKAVARSHVEQCIEENTPCGACW